jgi:uncharacterized protein (DUF2141 family)
MQRRRSHTVSILLGTSAKTALPGDPFRLGFIRLSRVLWLSVLVVMLGGLLEPEAAAQTVSFGAKTDFVTGSFPLSVAVGDFNGDGQLDLAVANIGSATVSILLGTGTGSFGAKTDFGTGNSPLSVAVGDFNGDGKLDLAVANIDSNTVSILLGTGTGSFGARTDFVTGSGPASVAVGDFNGDGTLDLAVANVNSATVSILLGTGTGSFGAKTDFGTGGAPASVAVGDFNGDGTLDLATANPDVSSFGFPETVSILLGTGTGSFGAKTDFTDNSGPFSVAVGDFNGDSKLDLAVANINGNTVSILLGTGTGSFGAKTDFGTGSTPFSVAVGDFNGDGKLDLATANLSSDTGSILLGTGTGSFGARTDFGTGSFPLSVAVGDFNGDGKLDLVVANRGSNTVSILLNTGPTGPGCSNPIDCPDAFVRQHYLDFLNRQADDLGLAFWTNEITSCGADPQCIEYKRINVSAAFYLSTEFQGTGYLVERVYKAAYGDATGTSTFGGTHQIPVPIIRLNEFLPDTQELGNGVIVNQPGWEQVLENNKQAFLTEFVQRNRFTTAYPQSMTAGQFVDKLNDNAGNVLSVAERDQLVNELTALTKTRAQVLRAVAEDADLNTIEFNRAFVLMQYLGYLRRNPNDAPDNDYTGFDFWLGKLNQFNGNYINAEMVKAFIVSGEYRGRFGP